MLKMCGGAESRRTPWYTGAVSGVSVVSGVSIALQLDFKDECQIFTRFFFLRYWGINVVVPPFRRGWRLAVGGHLVEH